jgi:Cd2+/Zn2+-exporting ATPase
MVGAAVGAAVIGEPFEGALLLFLFSLSNVLQDFALGRTKAAIKSLMDLRPAKARVLRQDKAVMIPVEAVGTEEIVLVKPGEKIPLDGDIITGHAAMDQADHHR